MSRLIKLFVLLALVTPMTMACVADSDPLAPEETEEALSLPPFRYQSLYMEAGGTVVQDLTFYTSMKREMDIRDIKVAVDSKSNAIVVVGLSASRSPPTSPTPTGQSGASGLPSKEWESVVGWCWSHWQAIPRRFRRST
ncbi:MAG: hypothetical protein A2653_02100 [Candidatus Zambryskibacteria bacterium RIFCSPHIGHO2_01_FULL_43_25]|uniref:Uncharacterized protein n=1 Tax=Candidatus Zambryskibacteria bacterium RIFCSPLOWO2_01_FULL_45_21 TaxID=1802761 RepID=A0A1G2U2Z3_9BACT|nr:MAG: hypothetical protein A2653_02100 [Candidatus Zambryskibacteria bacterium RIFCSPHIGHO2_01_FULL_43_25]OHA99983.1 MAG: hypothetical protein A3E94_03145 [Candidatus Zambryskibacteria bacterium RIFCSPHIGHO2_12_FULL_44_12b]OHB03819.1 MAG: hypothetical protein A3B14_03960 [Candidatus Zambryskibacteria bacterium RIFCSPLOWO2_01_FULL_45_21]